MRFFIEIYSLRCYTQLNKTHNCDNKKGEHIVNVSKLKGKIVERNTTQEELATTIGIDKRTFYHKIKQNGNFSIK